MRIAINGYFLHQPATGSGQHLYYLLEGLDAVDDSNHYLVLSPRLTESRVVRMPHLGHHFQVKEFVGTSGRLGMRLGKIWWEQWELSRVCAAARVDLLHSPYFASPLRPSTPTVVTIHDVIPLILPDYRRAPHVRIYMALVSAAAKRADAVITVSRASKLDIVRTLGIPENRVHVIYNAADRGLMPAANERELEAMRETHGIAGDFLLYFGGFDARKNVERILRAFHAARSSFQKAYQLVLAGSMNLVGHPLYPDPRPLIQKLGLQKEVVLTGKVSEEDKPLLYSGATAFLFPSLYEGFGMPVLEAMACGTPVITSNTSSLPEVAGDAALLVDPTSIDAIAEAMVRLTNDPNLRQELSRKGRQRAGQFSWEASAIQTLDIYQKVSR